MWGGVNVTPQYDTPFFNHAKASMPSLQVRSMTLRKFVANTMSSDQVGERVNEQLLDGVLCALDNFVATLLILGILLLLRLVMPVC